MISNSRNKIPPTWGPLLAHLSGRVSRLHPNADDDDDKLYLLLAAITSTYGEEEEEEEEEM